MLNDDAWLQRGEGGQKSGRKWLHNMWTLRKIFLEFISSYIIISKYWWVCMYYNIPFFRLLSIYHSTWKNRSRTCYLWFLKISSKWVQRFPLRNLQNYNLASCYTAQGEHVRVALLRTVQWNAELYWSTKNVDQVSLA